MDRWISVKDKLPMIEDEYLITFTARYGRNLRTRPLIAICEYGEYKGQYYWNTDALEYSDIEVTAWMPLPAPYREEDDVK